jgi:transcriptional antiterminator RfaH
MTGFSTEKQAVHWFVVHAKPRQEQVALENLTRQGYSCYLPTVSVERIRRGQLNVVVEPLFPRYLFVQLGTSESAQSWAPIRSTKGVSRLVTFGNVAVRADDELIAAIRGHANVIATQPQRLFERGERVVVTEGPFSGIEGIYQIANGERRAMVLIDFLTKKPQLAIPIASLRKAG